MTDSHGTILPAFTEHRMRHAGGSLYVRDFPGSGPAFVLLHGFPDNLLIYDNLIPHLAAAGRRTVAFDFLGFGASDKPEGAVYTFEQQLGDLEAVAKALELEKIIPVGHDAGGPAAVNFALRHPTRAAGICLMNAFYDKSPGLRVPELIELFANKNLKALTRHFLASPEQFAWLFNFQRGQWRFISDTRKAVQRGSCPDRGQELCATAERRSCLRADDLPTLRRSRGKYRRSPRFQALRLAPLAHLGESRPLPSCQRRRAPEVSGQERRHSRA